MSVKQWGLPKKRFFVSNHSSAYISFPGSQDYVNSTGLGYGPELIRGFELYTIEGKSYLLNKTTFKKELLSIQKHINAIPIEHKYERVPVNVSLSYRDIDYIGRIMRMKGKKVVPLFMGLNNAFVDAGGDYNSELAAEYKKIPI